jgi:hypothetical protein
VLPGERDTQERKFKEPTQAMHLLYCVLDVMGLSMLQNALTGLPASSISYSMSS